jgi:hypothetical protein
MQARTATSTNAFINNILRSTPRNTVGEFLATVSAQGVK